MISFYMLIMIMYILHVEDPWINLNMVYGVSSGVITQSLNP
jgi:hypothetical protein